MYIDSHIDGDNAFKKTHKNSARVCALRKQYMIIKDIAFFNYPFFFFNILNLFASEYKKRYQFFDSRGIGIFISISISI